MIYVYYITLVCFMLLCALLCFVIMIQESKSTGLGASFGGDAGGSVFGTSTATVLKKFTGWLAIAFFALCILLSLWTEAKGRVQEQRYQSEMVQ